MAARFPTFELLRSPSSLTSQSAQIPTLSFNASCLDQQDPDGVGEAVWTWSNFTLRQGHVAPDYNSSESYYQKFGGKHRQCDVFNANSCKFAPMLTPVAPWTIKIVDCDTIWRASWTMPDFFALRFSDGRPVVARNSSLDTHGALGYSAMLFSEAVKPVSWVIPELGVKTTASVAPIVVLLQPVLLAEPRVAMAPWVPLKVEQFYYTTGADTFVGINVLLLPRAADINTVRPITGVRIDAVTFTQQTAQFCGSRCQNVSLTCANTGNSSTTLCDNNFTIPVAFGPGSTTNCSLKPFYPLGVSGLSDTSCSSALSVSRAVNVTLRVKLGSSAAFGLPYPLVGNVSFGIVQGDNVDWWNVALNFRSDKAAATVTDSLFGLTTCRSQAFPVNPFAPFVNVNMQQCVKDEALIGAADFVTVTITNQTDGTPANASLNFAVARIVDGSYHPPMMLVNQSLLAASDDVRVNSLPQSYVAFATVQQTSANTFSFTPGTMCMALGTECTIELTVGYTTPVGPSQSRRILVMDPRLSDDVRSGRNATKVSFYNVLLREQGPLKQTEANASHAALWVAFVLAGGVFAMGVISVLSNDDALAVVNEHGRVVGHYIKKATGIDLKIGKRSNQQQAKSPRPQGKGSPISRSVPKVVAAGSPKN
jgi:hypothetical protein